MLTLSPARTGSGACDVIEKVAGLPARVPELSPDGFDQPAPGDGADRRWMLVGVDGSEESVAALRWAATNTARFGDVVPATAWRYPPWAVGRPAKDEPIAWPESGFIDHSRRRAASQLRTAGITGDHEHLIVEQAAGRMLVENSVGAELLVVGSRRRGRVSGSLLGTVSGYCVARASAPVAIVPLDHFPRFHRRVIVGVDESPEALAAAKWAVRHAPPDSNVHLIHVAGMQGDASRMLRQCVAAARASVDPSSSVVVTGRVSYGPPAETLRVASAGVDMLVLGRRSRGPIGHAFAGSVTTSLCRDPSVVTVVVPALHS